MRYLHDKNTKTAKRLSKATPAVIESCLLLRKAANREKELPEDVLQGFRILMNGYFSWEINIRGQYCQQSQFTNCSNFQKSFKAQCSQSVFMIILPAFDDIFISCFPTGCHFSFEATCAAVTLLFGSRSIPSDPIAGSFKLTELLSHSIHIFKKLKEKIHNRNILE